MNNRFNFYKFDSRSNIYQITKFFTNEIGLLTISQSNYQKFDQIEWERFKPIVYLVSSKSRFPGTSSTPRLESNSHQLRLPFTHDSPAVAGSRQNKRMRWREGEEEGSEEEADNESAAQHVRNIALPSNGKISVSRLMGDRFIVSLSTDIDTPLFISAISQ